MSVNPSCEEVRRLAPEVALGVAGGEERARVLGHLVGCPECRKLVAELAEVADELLLLAPEAEPSSGFESRTLERFSARRPRRWRTIAVAAAVGIASAAGVFFATGPDRELASQYRSALDEANGSYFGVLPLMERDEKAGNLFVYGGARSWIFVTLDEDISPGTYRAELMTRDGELLELGEFDVSHDDMDWGGEVPGSLRQIHAVRVVADQTNEVMLATFPRR
jgi:hypothetical protein